MKKGIDKILIFIGFAVVILGQIITSATAGSSIAVAPEAATVSVLGSTIMVLTVAFVFSSNSVVKNVGYGLGALVGASGVMDISIWSANDSLPGTMIISIIGELVILVAVIIYFVSICIKFFGFIKEPKTENAHSKNYELLEKYKGMETEGILSAEEFDKIKSEMFMNKEDKSEIDELKQWKKLLDKGIINDTEFSDIKSKLIK